MRQLGSSGVWELFIPAAQAGQFYKYEVLDANDRLMLKADPFASATERPPGSASRIWSTTHEWGDDEWLERRGQTDLLHCPFSIYEVHLGSWRRGEGDRELSYREVAPVLADYVSEMGFTHVEFLPLAEHPYTPSWGYQVTSYFAPTARYGDPDDFRFLVDTLHQRGIGVLVDWVPAHFPRDAWALARFDGTALFEHADPRQGEHPDWGTLVFNFGRHEVANFLVASGQAWIEDFHIDGLRVDAVASMLYLDYSRQPGQWIPNAFGGRENLDAVAFLRRTNELVHGKYPGVCTVAEESTAWPAVSRPVYAGGLGFTFKWNMGWMHDTLDYFAHQPVHRRYHHHELTFGLLYAFSENFVLPLSHDEVVHGKGSLLNKMPGDRWQQMANLRAMLAWMWAHPGRQLLFMGGELAQEREWTEEHSLDWHVLEWDAAPRSPDARPHAQHAHAPVPGAVGARLRAVGVPVDRCQRRRPERDRVRAPRDLRVGGMRGEPVPGRPTRVPDGRAEPRLLGGDPHHRRTRLRRQRRRQRATLGRGHPVARLRLVGGGDPAAARGDLVGPRFVIDPSAWGIAPGHHHVRGDWIPAPAVGVSAALAAMGASGSEGPGAPSTWVVRRDDGLDVPFEARVETEDGGTFSVCGRVPPEELPFGYHWLFPYGSAEGGGPIRLIVSPGVCPVPDRTWGWAAQLYATRSRSSWGIGDLADLRELVRWSASVGAGMVLVNPVHAVAPTLAQQSSPYFPASRRWRNPIYLRVEEVPGAGPDLDALAASGRALDDDRRIDRAAVWQLKRQALEQIWARGIDNDAYSRWAAAQGHGLQGFATWAALADDHGADWRRWPEGLQEPGSPEVAAFVAEHGDRVRFHGWLQWLLADQWAAAVRGAGVGAVSVVSDLAVGVDPAGADAWQWRSVLAAGVSIGAPPDDFNPGGQDWGLPPFDPWRLRQAGYEPFVDILRAAMAGGGGVRIDHVAGLFRLFWVPAESTAADGVYVSYPWRDLLNVVALEAARAGAFVVGEDLGTIQPWVREALAAARVLSYRLAWFEDEPPSSWPALALAAVTTHDLPTIGGVWTGADRKARVAAGLAVDDAVEDEIRTRVVRLCGQEDIGVTDVVGRVYRALAWSPARLATATLDDVLEVDERPNMPGTIDEWPNWSLALPVPLEEIERDERVLRVAGAFCEARPHPPVDSAAS